MREQKEKEKEAEKRKKEEAELRSYTTLMSSESMSKYDDGNDSDDFMWFFIDLFSKKEHSLQINNYYSGIA